jgi:hypothetical protein
MPQSVAQSSVEAMPDNHAAPGWDSHSIWRERVRQPQSRPQRGPAPHATRTTGWDPLETWRSRVREQQRRLGTSEPQQR